MKTRTVSSILGLIVVAGLAAWLNYNPDGSREMDLQASSPRQEADYLLAVSWHPSFCEMRPTKPECRPQPTSSSSKNALALHGLWPQPNSRKYCGVPEKLIALDKQGRWSDLPKLQLSAGTRQRLEANMPGYRSHLHRHEWYKHGTCMPGYTAEDYFLISLNLLEDINSSKFADWMRANLGRRVNYRDIDREFSRSFGAGSGKMLVVDCYRDDGRRIISELKLSIAGKLDRLSVLDDGLARAPELGSSCPSGIVDRPGQQ